ncbi:hypothetical protein SK128_018327 [Halocaridina rubra]|uniref:Neuroligin n=1 Tax=Halocaridina rubra TaxID=373956 RepID=A0AAN9A2X8_HALRR
MSNRGKLKDHYRAGQVALWSWLVPSLEKVGARHGANSSHHQLPDYDHPETYSGPTRPPTISGKLLTPPSAMRINNSSVSATFSPITGRPAIDIMNNSGNFSNANNDLLYERKQRHHQPRGKVPYTTALSLTIAIGCSLLILNILVFAAVYYRRDNYMQKQNKATSDNINSVDISGNDFPLHAKSENCIPSSPSHCETLRSSATLQSTLATSCESEEQQDWPPEYTSCCQGSSPSAVENFNTADGLPGNGTETVRTLPGTAPPPRTSLYPSRGDSQSLLSPSALLHTPNNAIPSEVRV